MKYLVILFVLISFTNIGNASEDDKLKSFWKEYRSIFNQNIQNSYHVIPKIYDEHLFIYKMSKCLKEKPVDFCKASIKLRHKQR